MTLTIYNKIILTILGFRFVIPILAAVVLLYVPQVAAQQNTTNTSTEVNWSQVAASGVTAAAVSSGISAFVNYKSIDKNYKNALNKLALQRQVDSVTEKVLLYSFFIFNLDRMIRNPDFSNQSEPNYKLKQTAEDIDNEVKAKYYRLNPEVAIQWLSLRHELKEMSSYSPETVEGVAELRNDLVKEYNDTIRPQYTRITTIDLDEFTPVEMPVKIEDIKKYVKTSNRETLRIKGALVIIYL